MLEAVWLIPALPLAGFLILLAFGRRLGDPTAGRVAAVMVGLSFIVTLVVFAGLMGRAADERSFTQTLFSWIPSGGLQVDMGFLVDPLSITMALFVTGVGTLIHLYSIGYMHGDERFPTFFVYLNLFVFSMLMLVLASNFVVTFLGWEGVGACSYLLISFWFERPAAPAAGKKAFVVNRIGDFGFMCAMFLMFSALGTLNYTGVLESVPQLSQSTVTAIALLLFLAAVGKSAQLPLYVWLPDAMEGPTPVSALIHAATMVTAGVFLMVRINPILHAAPDVGTIIAVVGAVTALFAATIACAQNDIKRVLAYSTISQLGYMFLAVGSAAYVAAIFHMITHAFFKALLFLGAGSVMHGMHDEQDMKKMGGLRKWMPITAGTFIVGWLAIAGVPPFSGFWSKDEILAGAYEKSVGLWVIGVVTALLTTYYMSRQVFLVFFGDERWKETATARSEPQAAAEPEHEPAAAHGAHGDFKPHESPWVMAFPLVALAVLAAIGGVINLPFGDLDFLGRWLEPVVGGTEHHLTLSGQEQVLLGAFTLVWVAIGMLAAYAAYLRHKVPEQTLEPAVLRNGWYVDQLYEGAIQRPGSRFASWSAYFLDAKVIDGAVNGIGAMVKAGGSRLRAVQTGYVRNYALVVVSGAVLLLAYVVVRAGV